MHLRLQLALLTVLAAVATASTVCVDQTREPALTTQDLSSRSGGFAFQLFKNVLAEQANSSTPDDNVFISPLSVWSALTMTYMGCEGDTQVQVAAALNLSGPHPSIVADTYQALAANLTHVATGPANYTFRLANKLYFEQTVPIKLTCINDQISGNVEKLDFVGAPQPSRAIINNWVANQTNDKIKDLLPADYITPQTTVVIVNAAYFNGIWDKKFTKGRTLADQDFFVKPDQPIKVMMMNQDARFLLKSQSQSLGCSAIELPYSGKDVSMVIVLPDTGVNIRDVVDKMTPEALRELRKSMEMTDVQLSMPKYKVEQVMELKEPVRQMGINDLFDPSAANLTGFTDVQGIFVKYIRHKTYIDVNEGGTEAAAATAIGATRLSAIIPKEKVPFVVNRPFLIFIVNNKLDNILFMGCIKEPKQN